MSSYGLWLSAAGMKVNDHKQTLLANNLANAHTTGFKRDLAIVMERTVESLEGPGSGFRFTHPVLDGMGGGINIRPPFQNFQQGSLENTGRELDVAIDGDGFFAVSDGDVTRYTRNGVFTLNRNQELVLSSGDGRWRVLDDGGSPISLDPEGGAVTITDQGAIQQNGTAVGKFGLYTTDNKAALRKVGETLFDPDDEEMKPATARILSGTREESNVEPVAGLASMIEATRAYQLNATLIQMQDELTGRVMAVGRPR